MNPNIPVYCLLEQRCGNKIYTLTTVEAREQQLNLRGTVGGLCKEMTGRGEEGK